MKKKWNLYSISESRGILMGVATLIVAFFHCYGYNFYSIISNNFIAGTLAFMRKTGNIGVDIFLFISAFGLYFSFSKDSNIKNFYKKRIVRVIPSLIIVASIYYLIRGVDALTFIKGVSLFSFYIDGVRDFWYIAILILLYLLYPIFYKVIEKKDIEGLLYLLLFSIGSTILLMNLFPAYYSKVEIALTRVPVFLIGIFVGKEIFLKKEIPELTMLIFLVMFIICSVVLRYCTFKYYIFVRYIYCVYGISIVFLISYLHSKIKLMKVDKFLIYIGTYSVEVYLIFEKLCIEIKHIKYINTLNNFVFYPIMFGITLIFSILLKKVCDLITNKL